MEDVGLFVIDLSECSNTGEIINNVSLALEIPNAAGRGISLKLNDNVLNQSQILSIKSLIESYNSRLINVETASLITKNACETMGIKVIQTKSQKIQTSEEAIIQTTVTRPEMSQETSMGPEIDEEFVRTQEIPENLAPQEEATGEPSFEEKVSQISSVQAEAMNKFEELKEQLPKEAITDDIDARKIEEEINNAISSDEEGFERQTISVYKKASEENLQSEEELEEINFYLPPTDEPVVIDSKQTIYVNQTLRSGQTLEFDGNIVIIGDCHPGSEIKATGDITVWGVLGSVAHAGSKGNRDAKIRALKMNAVQLRIANCYSRRPDGGNIPYIVKSAIFTPEEARIVDNNIVLFKMANQ